MTASRLLHRWTLTDWRPDALPCCTNPSCGREIQNGEDYYIVPNSVLVLCRSCGIAWRPIPVDPEPLKVATPKPPTPPKPLKVAAPKPPPKPRVKAPLTKCEQCGREFLSHKYGKRLKGHRYPHQRFCSQACWAIARPKREQKQCVNCNRMYYPTNYHAATPQRTCSRSCSWYEQRGRKNPSPQPLRWTPRHEKCLGCHSTSRKHRGRGLCSRCYTRQRSQTFQRGAVSLLDSEVKQIPLAENTKMKRTG